MNHTIKIPCPKSFTCKDRDGRLHGCDDIDHIAIEIKSETNGLFYVLTTVHAHDRAFADVYRSFIADYTDAKAIQEAPICFVESISDVFLKKER